MFTTFSKFVKPLTGLIQHSAHWLTSSSQGEIFIRKNPEMKEDREIAIYCVHGTADRCSAFSTLMKRLLPILPKEVVHIEMVSFAKRAHGKSIESFAEQLKNKIHAQPYKNIILMGHSRGGLVASYFAENLSKEMSINILQVICISSPIGGSDYAFFPVSAISSSVDEMKPDSDFLKSLSQKMKKSSIKYRYFAGDRDDLVSVSQACLHDQNHLKQLTILDHHGHLSIMTSSRLAIYINYLIQDLIQEVTPTREFSF